MLAYKLIITVANNRFFDRFEFTYTSKDLKWILFQDDDTIIDEYGFNLLLKNPNSPVAETNCLAKMVSNELVERSRD